ncbi:MAG: hypothetical protein ACRC6T_08115 [Sarcina sp.]
MARERDIHFKKKRLIVILGILTTLFLIFLNNNLFTGKVTEDRLVVLYLLVTILFLRLVYIQFKSKFLMILYIFIVPFSLFWTVYGAGIVGTEQNWIVTNSPNGSESLLVVENGGYHGSAVSYSVYSNEFGFRKEITSCFITRNRYKKSEWAGNTVVMYFDDETITIDFEKGTITEPSVYDTYETYKFKK